MNRTIYALAGGVMLALVGGSAHTDDTEIYVGSTAVSRKPNVLFIMDTSGSMNESQLVINGTYDHTVDYEGDCVEGRIYWSQAGNAPPSCSGDRYVNENAINEDASTCDDLSQIDSPAGMAIAKAQQNRYWLIWRFWQTLQVNNHDDDVRCHGDGEVYHFYSANYVNWFHSEADAETMTRMEIVQDVAKDLVDSISGVNIGLMRFRGNNGGYVDYPVTDIIDSRDYFKERIDTYNPDGNTPLAETMYEATLYWRGERIKYGNSNNHQQGPPTVRDGQNYISPIEHACQKNHVVYLTDGEPTNDTGADDEISDLVGSDCSGNCLDELAEFLYENDQSDTVSGVNNVITHTVGFHTDQDLLRDAARKGGGNYYTADDYDQLKNSLTSLFTEILSGTSMFTAPAVSVNAFNRLSHIDQIYFALFRPDEGSVWPGNVKRYRLDPATGELVDVNDDPALNVASGEFNDTITSFWSDVQDGNDVRLGGIAGELTTARNVYTYLGSETDVALTGHPLHEDNEDITRQLLGLNGSQTEYRTRLLQWARGVDVDDVDGDGQTDDARLYIGDPLHSKPALVTYGNDANDPQLTLFVTTNQGFLHGIDTSSGAELFAFMPGELLPNLKTQYENSFSGDRIYGLDGPMSVSTEDGVQLFFGQRRGGKHYYAVDVSDREEPRLLWSIEGGIADDDFEELGQTWSKPVPTMIDLNGEQKHVLVFAGGYDPGQDAYTVRTSDAQGRAIFIVDAASGVLLWSGGHADGDHDRTFTSMDYSIPSDVTVLDTDGDKLADQIYVGDMGGQLWRFDIHNGELTSGLVTGGVIADLSADNETENTRRFYYPPDIAMINEGGHQWLSMSIGSGWRAHPLDTVVEDRFYMLRNSHIFGPPRNEEGVITYTQIGESDLYDATDNLIQQASTDELRDEERRILREDKEGWYIELENSGEKVLAESVTLAGQLIFTTYQPDDGQNVSSCAPGEGIARYYAINVTNATPSQDRNGDGVVNASDRSAQLRRGGIPPAPTAIFIEGESNVLIGPEKIDTGAHAQRRIIYWRER